MTEVTFSLDLHVLGPPLTFALSQDQTLHRKDLNPALHRLIGATPGGRCAVRCGMVSLRTETHIIIRLAIQFSETDPSVAARRHCWLGAGFSRAPRRPFRRREAVYTGTRVQRQRPIPMIAGKFCNGRLFSRSRCPAGPRTLEIPVEDQAAPESGSCVAKGSDPPALDRKKRTACATAPIRTSANDRSQPRQKFAEPVQNEASPRRPSPWKLA